MIELHKDHLSSYSMKMDKVLSDVSLFPDGGLAQGPILYIYHVHIFFLSRYLQLFYHKKKKVDTIPYFMVKP